MMTKNLSVERLPAFNEKFDMPGQDRARDLAAILEGRKDVMLMDYMHDSKITKRTGTTGTTLWDHFQRRIAYYVPELEQAAIKQHAKDIAQTVSGASSLIDLGPGPLSAIHGKTRPILQQCDKINNYLAIDLCQKYVEIAQSYIGKKFPDIAIEGAAHNMYQCGTLYPLYNSPVGIMFGCTITNVGEAHTIRPYNTIDKLVSLRKMLGPNGYLVITQDTNRDESSLSAAYNSKECEELCMNVLYRTQEELDLDLNCDLFEYQYEWRPDFNHVGGDAVATANQTVILLDKKYEVKKGQRIPLFRSYKYSSDQFKHIGIEAGFLPLKTFKDSSGRIALHIWRT